MKSSKAWHEVGRQTKAVVSLHARNDTTCRERRENNAIPHDLHGNFVCLQNLTCVVLTSEAFFFGMLSRFSCY